MALVDLDHAILTVFVTVMISGQLLAVITEHQIMDYSACSFRGGGYGEVTQCFDNEVMLGSCASGKDPDCKHPKTNRYQYDIILCCPLENLSSESCSKQYGSYGEGLSCLEHENTGASNVRGVCGSGKNRDCNGQVHMIDCCTGHIRTGTNSDDYAILRPDDCRWQYANYGERLQCREKQAIFGRCGSGRNADCIDRSDPEQILYWYHGIQCCTMVSW